MRVDWLIVGAGYTGCVIAERIATQLDKKVLIVDRRDHVGGNAYDCYDERGVLIHKYGAHIFHTNSIKVWNYLSQFTEWMPYQHRVLAVVDGVKVPVPFNLNSLYALFPKKYAERLESSLVNTYSFGGKVPILKMRESEDKDLRNLSDFIYEKIFYKYTLKQWELKPEELDPSVTGRVPICISRDDRYFQDTYQAMPRYGYARMFQRMIKHQNIKVLLNTDYKEVLDQVIFSRMVYTGPIDAFFDYDEKPLPYRSLRFEMQSYEQESHQGAAVINYPNEYDLTRILEYKFMTGQRVPFTSIATEYPQAHVPGQNEAYYPVPKEEYREQYMKYVRKLVKTVRSVIFAGRLADYKYYNMDQAVARAITVFEKEIASKR